MFKAAVLLLYKFHEISFVSEEFGNFYNILLHMFKQSFGLLS